MNPLHYVRPHTIVLCVALILLLPACVTRAEKFVEADDFVYQRQYEQALNILEDSAQQELIYPPTDRVLKLLDIGMLHFYGKNYARAQEYLTMAEYLMEELFTASITQAIGSLVLNDTVIDYPGEAYEEFYVNIFKAVSFLAENKFDSAFVEIRRLNNKLNLLEDRYSSLAEEYNDSDDTVIAAQSGGSEFYSSALGRYVSMLVYRADGDVDGARIDAEAFSRAFRTQPTVYDFPQPDIDPLLKNSAGTRINVLAFAGRIPEKRASVFFIRTFEDRVLILVQKENNKGILETTEVESFGWPGMTEGYQFTFELPFLRSIPSRVERVELVVDGLPAGDLDLIENLGNVSAEVYRAKEAIIYVKTITRTILKGLLNQELKSGVTGENALLGTILGFFTDIAVHASEEADLRSARYYPSLAFAGEFSIDPGRRSAALNYYDASDNLIFSEEIGENDYRGDGLNLMYAYVPW